MLNPPPEPKIVKERKNKKIFFYITESMKKNYEALKGDNTWSQIGRKAFKQYFDGEDGNVHKISPNIEAILYDAIAIMKGLKLPTQPRNLEEEAKYDEARKQAVARKEVQVPLHINFRAECVPELKEKFKKVEEIEDWKERWEVMGLEHAETHESPKVDDKSFADFINLTKELNQKGFENCKWKKKNKEVIV
jgi:hypothetical protein